MTLKDRLKGALFGEAIGDALGVPVEFKRREYLRDNPIEDFEGFRCWDQPPGTFSDDSSMMFCTVESLCNGYNLVDIANNFVKWYKEGYWGAHDVLFDIGRTTRLSLQRVSMGCDVTVSGEFLIESNGNGSLMRIIPLVFHLLNNHNVDSRFEIIKAVSSITHAHFRSFFSCFIYCEYCRLLVEGKDKIDAYYEMQKMVLGFSEKQEFNKEEVALFDRILRNDIWRYEEKEIRSLGYVLDSLEASFWCFLNTDSYDDSVLKAVNLGGDTDTTGAITGGLSGLYYGNSKIKSEWIDSVVKSYKIEVLSDKFYTSIDQ